MHRCLVWSPDLCQSRKTQPFAMGLKQPWKESAPKFVKTSNFYTYWCFEYYGETEFGAIGLVLVPVLYKLVKLGGDWFRQQLIQVVIQSAFSLLTWISKNKVIAGGTRALNYINYSAISSKHKPGKNITGNPLHWAIWEPLTMEIRLTRTLRLIQFDLVILTSTLQMPERDLKNWMVTCLELS